MATTPVPLQTYVDAAMRHVTFAWLPDDKMWLAEIGVAGFEGAFSAQPTQDWARRELREIVEDWVEWAVEDGDPLPDIDGVTLDRSTVAA